MSNIKVVDLNEEGKEEVEPTPEIEETEEEGTPDVIEGDDKTDEPANEIVEPQPVQETPIEKPKEEVLEKPVKAMDKKVRCPRCSKEMKLKNFRYTKNYVKARLKTNQ